MLLPVLEQDFSDLKGLLMHCRRHLPDTPSQEGVCVVKSLTLHIEAANTKVRFEAKGWPWRGI